MNSTRIVNRRFLGMQIKNAAELSLVSSMLISVSFGVYHADLFNLSLALFDVVCFIRPSLMLFRIQTIISNCHVDALTELYCMRETAFEKQLMKVWFLLTTVLNVCFSLVFTEYALVLEEQLVQEVVAVAETQRRCRAQSLL